MGLPGNKPGAPPAKPAFDASIYATRGPYDRTKVYDAFDKAFPGGGFATTTHDDVDAFLKQIEDDADITDLRWAAYMLATVHLEAKVLVTEKVLTDSKGNLLTDKKGNPTPRLVHKWQLMQPVEESGHGAGLAYYEPVKTATQLDGSILVTEHDGDQFTVNALGNINNFDADKRGADADSPASDVFTKAAGTANRYFGRGYVQLTWWDGYLRAGKELGLGTQLLLDPAQVQHPDIAYKIISYGMRTGKIFANGHSFGDFFTSTETDYVHARKMVNGSNRNQEIALIAKKYEAILLGAKPGVVAPPAAPSIPLSKP
jgi:hypothetical protein